MVNDNGEVGPVEEIASAEHSDFHATTAADSDGNITVVRQSFQDLRGEIYSRRRTEAGWGREVRISRSIANDWERLVASRNRRRDRSPGSDPEDRRGQGRGVCVHPGAGREEGSAHPQRCRGGARGILELWESLPARPRSPGWRSRDRLDIPLLSHLGVTVPRESSGPQPARALNGEAAPRPVRWRQVSPKSDPGPPKARVRSKVSRNISASRPMHGFSVFGTRHPCKAVNGPSVIRSCRIMPVRLRRFGPNPSKTAFGCASGRDSARRQRRVGKAGRTLDSPAAR